VDFLAPHGTAYVTELLQRHAEGDDKFVGLGTVTESVNVHSDVGKPTSLHTDGLCANRLLKMVSLFF